MRARTIATTTALLLAGVAGCEPGEPAGAVDGGEQPVLDAAGAADAAEPGRDATVRPDGGTGAAAFWRTERDGATGRWWFVSPEGGRTFQLGVNTVMREPMRGGASQCNGIRNWIRRTTPTRAAHVEWARLSDGESGGYSVPRPYCFNAVGGYSDINDFDDSGGDSYMIRPVEAGGAGAPYSVVVSVSPRGDDRALKDENGTVLIAGIAQTRVGDPFHPAFLADLDAIVADEIAPRRDDSALQLWYLGNEAGMFDKAQKGANGVRDFRRWIWSDCPDGSSIDAPLCARHALAAFLRERYPGGIADLNAAWAAGHASFAAIVDVGPRPVPYAHDCNLACRTDLQRFVHDRLLRQWVRAVTTRVRAADPNHLLSSPKLALGSPAGYRFFAPASSGAPDVWAEDEQYPVGTDTAEVKYSPFDLLARDGDAGFDVVSFNVYSGAREFATPWFTDGAAKVHAQAGLPVVISELSVRARIDGWSNRGGAGSFVPHGDATDDQIQRGAYYREQLRQLLRLRFVIGANWHAWSDRYMPADDSKQINMGIVQCDDPIRGHEAGRRWGELDDRMSAFNCNIAAEIAAIDE